MQDKERGEGGERRRTGAKRRCENRRLCLVTAGRRSVGRSVDREAESRPTVSLGLVPSYPPWRETRKVTELVGGSLFLVGGWVFIFTRHSETKEDPNRMVFAENGGSESKRASRRESALVQEGTGRESDGVGWEKEPAGGLSIRSISIAHLGSDPPDRSCRGGFSSWTRPGRPRAAAW